MGLSLRRPSIPFRSLNLEELRAMIPQMRSSTWYYANGVRHQCRLVDLVTDYVGTTGRVGGLQLKQAYTRVPLNPK